MTGSRARVAGVALCLAVLAPLMTAGCGGGDGGYRLVAVFERTVGLYPHGDVLVMGMQVGTVEAIELDGTVVRVEIRLDRDVPLPADVQATIGQTQLIGERNVVLFPPWNAEMAAAGKDKASDGDVIPLDRTQVPVEPDEGLEAFDELARSLDPAVVGGFVSDSASVLRGRGEQLGAAIDQASSLGTTLAQIDEQLVASVDALHQLAGSLTTREAQLARLVEQFSAATSVLASERDGLARMLASLVELTEQGHDLLDLYGDQLPRDIATFTALASIFERNIGSLGQLLAAFPALTETIRDAYQPDIDGIYLRAGASPTIQALLTTLTESLGILPGGQP